MDIHDALLDELAPAGARAHGEQRPLTEADFARSYVTHSELFGSNPTWELFFDRLRDIGLQSVMASLSFINSVLYVKGGIQAQREIVSNTFDSDLMARLVAAARSGESRRVFTRTDPACHQVRPASFAEP